jgi:cyclase
MRAHLLSAVSRITLLLVLSVLSMPGPAVADVDISGEWTVRFHEDAPHRGAGPEIGDYTGLPINEAGRRKAESWDASILSTRERQCIPHAGTYQMRGPANIRIWKETDELAGSVVAYHIYGTYGRPRTFWMDGRPHPSANAPHTWTGFSTGTWEGSKLTVTTTHLKMGWIQRNGVPTSDLTTMTEHFIRHGDNLLVITVVNDPVYLSEPFIRSGNWVLNLAQTMTSFGSCGPAAEEVGAHPKGYVPHHLPGTNTDIQEFLKAHNVPASAAAGGPETTYPEYTARLEQAQTAGRTAGTRPGAPAASGQRDQNGEIEMFRVQGNVYMIVGAGGNITAQIGDDGVLVVDTGSGTATDKVLAAIKRVTDKPIRYILNTSVDADHTGGNDSVAKAGARIATVMVTANLAGEGAAIVAHEKVLNAMSAPTGQQSSRPATAWPTDTYFTDTRNLFFNGEAIQMLHQPQAHTDGDSIVFFRRSDVVSAGDVLDLTRYPVIDGRRGGRLTGVIDALNRIVELAIPRDWQEGGTMVIPGHGRLADAADVIEYRDMVTIIRDRIQDLIKKGMMLEQVKAARPSLDYDGRYGATSGAWTTEMFLEAAYRDLATRR